MPVDELLLSPMFSAVFLIFPPLILFLLPQEHGKLKKESNRFKRFQTGYD
ncbi:hypothetical protein BRO54_2644 [Geobacillus proteiniphilus]|uniref:Uncharacterized protein n=1 Tax=Geobacillus proteiniphilus TaxID=860353 RepID=A0A1Q5SU70_9BACL|nr:hypothetical protein BRO54_2644 [Geobacillus proteiniphilus]